MELCSNMIATKIMDKLFLNIIEYRINLLCLVYHTFLYLLKNHKNYSSWCSPANPTITYSSSSASGRSEKSET
jgi:hypothetical protein